MLDSMTFTLQRGDLIKWPNNNGIVPNYDLGLKFLWYLVVDVEPSSVPEKMFCQVLSLGRMKKVDLVLPKRNASRETSENYYILREGKCVFVAGK